MLTLRCCASGGGSTKVSRDGEEAISPDAKAPLSLATTDGATCDAGDTGFADDRGNPKSESASRSVKVINETVRAAIKQRHMKSMFVPFRHKEG